MKVLVAGAGALGSWLGGELAAGGAQVVMVARGAHAAAMAGSGLAINRDGGHIEIRPLVFETLAEAVDAGPFDMAIVTVKAYDTASLAEELAASETPRQIWSFQNGVGSESELAQGLPGHHICSGTVTSACRIVAPGRVEVTSKGGVGLARGPGADCDTDALVELLKSRGVAVRDYPDAQAMKWSKLLLNMLGAATCAVLGWPPARVFENRGLFRVELAAWSEALAVLRALDKRPLTLPSYPLPVYAALVEHLPEALAFRLLAPRLARGRGERLPGPAADLAAGRQRSEIEYLNGAVARAGADIGLATPINAGLAGLVAEIATGGLDHGRFAGKPEVLIEHLAEQKRAVDTTSVATSVAENRDLDRS